jgi:thiol:disulfide interchange protein
MHRIVFLAIVGAAFVSAQPAASTDHVHWDLSAPASAAPGSKFIAKLRATVDPEWHLYSMTTPQPGPVATTIKITGGNENIEKTRLFEPKPITQYDANFQRNTETYINAVTFEIEITLKPDASQSPMDLKASARYQVCSSTVCIPPVTRVAGTSVEIDKKAAKSEVVIPGDYREAKPVSAPGATTPVEDQSAITFLLTAFGFGLAAIFTPCVFPMIPITVSYFLGQGQNTQKRGESLKQAVLFCLGIIVLFSALGVATTAVLGPFGVVQLGSNPWVNGLIVLVFCVFGLSLLGAFEITIPSFILTKLDSASRGGGTAGTLLMGLTFSLASFACVGPFVGPLLAASVTGGYWRPLMGMAAFASGLALPFFVLALFPSYLKKLPRSGGWLARVKVVMGFVILAAALKYLASMDAVLQWGFLTRDRFLAAWVVLFAMAGLYLLGFLHLEGVTKDDSLSIPRLLSGMALVMFAVSLAPGMFGGNLGELEGFVPPPAPGASFGGGAEQQLVWIENDFNGAIAKARAENKRVLVNFTGYACTNCHWMKQNMFTKPEVAQVMRNLVLVDLYTDRDDAVSQQNQQLEQAGFNTIAIPFYVLYDPAAEGEKPRVVATFPGLTREAPQYVSFLSTPSPQRATAAAKPAVDLGVSFGSTDLANKVVVANFWATWCVPCRKEIPEFNKLQESLGARGVQVVGVSLDDDADVIKPFQTKNPMNYPVELATDETKKSYNLDQLPVTVVFNRKGQIVDRFVGFTEPEKIRAAVEKAL